VATRSKLTQYKEWLTVAEAAQHLSAFGEPISEADVLRLVQEGQLKLFVRFLDTFYGQYVAERRDNDVARRHRLEDGVVFELPMFGAGRLAVEEAYRGRSGKPGAALRHTDALEIVDAVWDDRYQVHFRADHSPVTRLPDSAVMLLRRDAVDKFGRGLPAGEERPVMARERETLYAVIAALCDVANLKMHEPSKVFAAIEPHTKRLLPTAMPLRTVQNLLKNVREQFGID